MRVHPALESQRGRESGNLYRGEKQIELRSRQPKKVRTRTWTPALVEAVETLRADFPMWGKTKLGPFLRGARRRLRRLGCHRPSRDNLKWCDDTGVIDFGAPTTRAKGKVLTRLCLLPLSREKVQVHQRGGAG